MITGNHSDIVSHPSLIASQLGLNYGENYLTPIEKRLYKKHFDNNGEPIVVMYGADWCGYCRKLAKGLVDNDITYIEIDVDSHQNREKIFQTMNISGYPSTWYGYHRVSGTDIGSVERTMKMASK